MARSSTARRLESPIGEADRTCLELDILCAQLDIDQSGVVVAVQKRNGTRAQLQAVLVRRGRPGHRYTDARGIRREIVREETVRSRRVR